MKKFISIALCAIMILSFASCKQKTQVKYTGSASKVEQTFDFSLSANELCKTLGAGWNLGNTLDAHTEWGEWVDNPSVEYQETGWNNPVTTEEMMAFVKKSGFDSVRIPVTWYLQTEEKDGVYTIKQEWMDRVKQVAEYSLNYGLYTIVDMHHDDNAWLSISGTDAEFKKVKEQYKQLWTQIATAFKDYGDHLILEGANEITATTKFDGCGDTDGDCWWGHEKKSLDRLNELHQIFVDTVRGTGGYNSQRYLMIPTYGAQWYTNQINNLKIPNNDDHIIMDVHWYQTNTSNKDSNAWVFSAMRTFADENNIGAVLGESGMVASASDSTKEDYGKNVVGCAAEYDIPVFLWDDGGDVKIMNRTELTWNSDAYIKSVIDASK